MEKDILRQVIRQTITEMFDLLDKGMLGSELPSSEIKEESSDASAGKEQPKTEQ